MPGPPGNEISSAAAAIATEFFMKLPIPLIPLLRNSILDAPDEYQLNRSATAPSPCCAVIALRQIQSRGWPQS
jgi:hypothetical protein